MSMVEVVLAHAVAFAAMPECPPAHPIDVGWSHASSIAIRLHDGTFKAKRDDPYESGQRIVSADRTIFIGYMGGSFHDWADDVRFVCRASIDGYDAEVFRWKSEAQPRAPYRIGVVFVRTPMHRTGFTVDIPYDGAEFSRQLDELLSIKFINDSHRLKLLRIDRTGSSPVAVFRNEIGEEFRAGIGEGVTRGQGLGRGLVERIDAHRVHVREYAADHCVNVVFSTSEPVRRRTDCR